MSIVFKPKIAYGFRQAKYNTDKLGSTSHAQIKELINLRMKSVPFRDIALKLGKSRSHWCYEAKRLWISDIVASKRKELSNKAGNGCNGKFKHVKAG